MKKTLIKYAFVFLTLLLCSCSTTLKSIKLGIYKEKIEDELTIYYIYTPTIEAESVLAEAVKRRLIKEFGARGVQTEVSIIAQSDNRFIAFGQNIDIKTSHNNGLILILHEAITTSYTSNLESSEYSVTLIDKNQDRNIWKTTIPNVSYKNVPGGLDKGMAGYMVNSLMKTLEKDDLVIKKIK